MGQSKKLKRGLKDVSPLFSKGKKTTSSKNKEIYRAERVASAPKPMYSEPEPVTLSVQPEHMHCFGVYRSRNPNVTFNLTSYLAAQITHTVASCRVVSLKSCQFEAIIDSYHPEFPSAQHLSVSREQWKKFKIEHVSETGHPTFRECSTVILDLPFTEVADPFKVSSVVDRWILHVGSELEELMDAYRFLKQSAHHHPGREYYFLYDGPLGDSRAESLFEKFSALVAEQLDINLIWIGSLLLGKHGLPVSSELYLEPLFLETGILNDFSDRMQFACFIESNLKSLSQEQPIAI